VDVPPPSIALTTGTSLPLSTASAAPLTAPPVRPVVPDTAAPAAAKPGPEPARAAATAPAVTLRDTAEVQRSAVRSVLARYESAYTQLDATAAAAVYPQIDRKALAKAFAALEAQRVQFHDCSIDVGTGEARASCTGVASYTPKVGGSGGSHQRRWEFALKERSGTWQIDTVSVR
jgi:hypothetical protein